MVAWLKTAWPSLVNPAQIRRLGREFFWVMLGQGVAALGAIVGVRLLTHALEPARYGELALGATVAMLSQQTILGPLCGAFLRFFAPAQELNQLRSYLAGVQRLLLRATGLMAGVMGAVSLGLWATGHAEWLSLVVASFLFALLSGYSSILDSMQNAARQRVIVAWHDGLAPWLRYLAAILLISLFGGLSNVAMWGYALASGVVLGSQLLFFRRRIMRLSASQLMIHSGEVESWTTQMWQYAWPISTWGMFTWAQIASDRWTLQAFSTSNSVGLYAVLYQLGYYPITLLSGLMMQLITPVIFSRAGDGTDPRRLRRTRQANRWLIAGSVALTGGVSALAFLYHIPLFNLLVAPEYRAVSSLLPIIVLSGGLFASGQIASLTLMTDIRSRELIAPKIVTALLGALLNGIGAYAFGLRGVVLASFLFSSVYFAWMLLITRKSEVGLSNIH